MVYVDIVRVQYVLVNIIYNLREIPSVVDEYCDFWSAKIIAYKNISYIKFSFQFWLFNFSGCILLLNLLTCCPYILHICTIPVFDASVEYPIVHHMTAWFIAYLRYILSFLNYIHLLWFAVTRRAACLLLTWSLDFFYFDVFILLDLVCSIHIHFDIKLI